MSPPKIPCAILGASGYIGQHFARLLADHPLFERPSLVSTERSAGRTLAELWQLESPPPEPLADVRLHPWSASAIAGARIRVVFSALPSGTAGPIETELTRRGVSVFTNAADHRMDPGVPLLVPEVNREHLRMARSRAGGRGLLVANPNCSTTGLVVALAPVWGILQPRAVHVATYQSLSGAGYPGVPSLAITDNVVPFIREEEEKVERESARILGTRRGHSVRPITTPFLAHCVRVATREGHLEAVTVEAGANPTRDALLTAWASFDPLADLELAIAPRPPVELRSEADRPQPLRDRWAGRPAPARGMAVVVGRARWARPYLRFFVLSHNAVRGGAGGSVLNAEVAVATGLLDRASGARR